MPNALTLASDFTSIALSVSCWSLTHTYAAAGYPHGRPIAGIWASIGMVVLFVALARHNGMDPSWLHVLLNVLVLAVTLLLARRTQVNAEARRRMMRRASFGDGSAVRR